MEVVDLTRIFVGFFFSVMAVFIFRRLRFLSRLPPGPWGFPFFGYVPFVDPEKPYESFEKMRRKYGKIFTFKMGSVRIVALGDHKLIKSAFSKEIYAGRPPLPVTHGIMKGFGIVGSEGSWWWEQRRFLTDCLRELGIHKNSANRFDFEEKMAEEVEFCVEEFNKNANGLPFKCHSILSSTFGNIICKLLFDRRFPVGDSSFERQLQLVDWGFKMVSVMGALNFFPLLRFIPYYRSAYEQLLEFKKEHHRFFRNQIDDHVENLDENNPRDYLDMFLIQQKRKENQPDTSFTDSQLIHAIADIFGAGIETGKVTFHWCLLYLITNLDVQEKLQKELDEIVGKDRNPTLNDASFLPYTEAVILETQRLANLVPIGAPHGTTKDSELEGYFIPRGTMMMGLLWSVHRNPSLWDQPEVFSPSRFIDSDGKIRKFDYFMPFSAGRRMCPGEELAKMELFLLVTTIFQKFTILPVENEPPNLTPQMGFTLTPLPYKIRIIPRNI